MHCVLSKAVLPEAGAWVQDEKLGMDQPLCSHGPLGTLVWLNPESPRMEWPAPIPHVNELNSKHSLTLRGSENSDCLLFISTTGKLRPSLAYMPTGEAWTH